MVIVSILIRLMLSWGNWLRLYGFMLLEYCVRDLFLLC